MGKLQLSDGIKQKIETVKNGLIFNGINNSMICDFASNNIDIPDETSVLHNYFTKFFSKLENKIFSSFDLIHNIILKRTISTNVLSITTPYYLTIA